MRYVHASIRPTACLIALLCALFGSRAAQAQGSRLPQDEIVYQIMPIAWRDSNLDTTATSTGRPTSSTRASARSPSSWPS